MYLYLYVNLAIIIFPLAISFERRRINFHSRLKPVALSIIFVSAMFVAWDAIATYRGHWSFNPDHVLGIGLLGLPLEELLFFITVPFSCLFTYEALGHFVNDKSIKLPGRLPLSVAVVFVLLSLAFMSKEYTFLALLSVSASILVASAIAKGIFSSRLYWLYISVTLLFFLVFNYLLTSIPVVEYSSLAISGLRLTTIPIEDFMFNFSMLTLYLSVYLSAVKKLGLN